jgi:hypothetical protein
VSEPVRVAGADEAGAADAGADDAGAWDAGVTEAGAEAGAVVAVVPVQAAVTTTMVARRPLNRARVVMFVKSSSVRELDAPSDRHPSRVGAALRGVMTSRRRATV